MYCPQCGLIVEIWREGVCLHCWQDNQDTLDDHNHTFEEWSNLSPDERDARIRWAANHPEG